MDAAVLAQKLVIQENVIIDLRAQVENLEQELLRAESARMEEREKIEASTGFELTSSLRRQDLLQIGLDEANSELSFLKQRNLELEKNVVDLQIISYSSKIHLDGGKFSSSVIDQAVDTGENGESDIAGNVFSEELEATKLTLRERTTQLKTLMDTLEALQSVGSSALGDNSIGDHDRGRTRTSGGINSTWGIQALVKRFFNF